MFKQQNYSLLKHNTFGIDAHCRMFIEYNSVEELCELLCDTNLPKPLFHIGEGSNLLFTKDFDGTIFHSCILGKEIVEDAVDSVLLKVGAGEDWDNFVDWTLNYGFYGLENLSLIPGEVGASAVQNIGAYGAEAEQYIEKVAAVCLATGESRIFLKEECDYAYRSSIFKHALRGQYIVTHVYYRLQKTFQINLTYAALCRELESRGLAEANVTAREVRNIIVEVRRNKLPDPKEIGSAGSFFMNPIVSEKMFQELLSIYPEIPYYKMPTGVKIPAGWLIQQVGWKGKTLGRAGVYPKQALVLVNLGGASGEDIMSLSNKIIHDVQQQFEIELKPEVNFI
ncbi:UDP-N-acetylmuramate dehydrogenase [Alloprevotella rava]|uniref:UDP-N-acetylenolpyruvoylglucosamine reductase n=1 Tax=Alloprevotella rava TaxID=671218 RepID=A0A7W5UKH0_9BACT|nr:UDP-N-acetylmuramate dehydrogenase [Alloprevotella rava]MBB3702996.1 UDP-N-acetylmuramate dehydrogenase [Alloprevotella rava]